MFYFGYESFMKKLSLAALFVLVGCVSDKPKCEANPEGPWYSEQFLKDHPELLQDSPKCSKYYENEALLLEEKK
jgi:hypothetical protein